MSEPAISIRNLSKCYQLGTIGRHTLAEEVEYWWHRLRGRDPRNYLGKIGAAAEVPRPGEAHRRSNPEFWALREVSFDVAPGEVVALIGRNGAGKSTLLKILTRITDPTAGLAVVNGRVGSLLEVGTGFHPELTGRENTYMNGAILGMKRREIDAKLDEIVAFAEIEEFIDTPVKRYSKGMYVRLAFAVAAHLEPEILLVDEVLAVGDAEFQKKCLGKMGDVAQEGRTVIFVSHNLAAIQYLCDRGIVLDHGRMLMDDKADKAIAYYLTLTGGNRKVEFHRDMEKQPPRSPLFITTARLENPDGSRLTALPMGGDLTARIRVAARQDADCFIASVTILDALGSRLCSVNSQDIGGTFFSLRAGKQLDVVCTLPAINLLAGVYAVEVGLHHPRSRETFDYVKGELVLEVLPRDVFGTGKIPGGPGVIFVHAHWREEAVKIPAGGGP